MAHMVLEKGKNPFAIAMISREIELSGYNRLILKTDQEPAILALCHAVAAKRDSETIVQPGPRHDPKSKGAIENVNGMVEGLLRVYVAATESHYKTTIEADHPVLPWIVRHVGWEARVRMVGGLVHDPLLVEKRAWGR